MTETISSIDNKTGQTEQDIETVGTHHRIERLSTVTPQGVGTEQVTAAKASNSLLLPQPPAHLQVSMQFSPSTQPSSYWRREFKISGQMDQKDKLTFSSLAHQIDNGLHRDCPEVQASIVASLLSASPYPSTSQRHNWTRLQCFGQRLHLKIEYAMRDPRIDRAVVLCKKLVSSFSHSWRRKKQFTKAQRELKLPEHTLETQCPTRSSVLRVNDDETDLTCSIKTKILSSLEEKYNDHLTQELLDMASALNPRFRLSYISGDNVASIHARLTLEMVRTAPAAAMAVRHGPMIPVVRLLWMYTHYKKENDLGVFFKAAEGATQRLRPLQDQQAISSELQSYLLSVRSPDRDPQPPVSQQLYPSNYSQLDAAHTASDVGVENIFKLNVKFEESDQNVPE
ncbi:hypothetical protein FQN60_005422, partial [Etheostoma spectabile]